mmetsp:Transcript_20340/g.57775  ORF Transcript_20340/g.57775 Transcript_20340/m.57775 type:complete len:216 (+) Transcript_20340:369-1016(+)
MTGMITTATIVARQDPDDLGTNSKASQITSQLGGVAEEAEEVGAAAELQRCPVKTRGMAGTMTDTRTTTSTDKTTTTVTKTMTTATTMVTMNMDTEEVAEDTAGVVAEGEDQAVDAVVAVEGVVAEEAVANFIPRRHQVTNLRQSRPEPTMLVPREQIRRPLMPLHPILLRSFKQAVDTPDTPLGIRTGDVGGEAAEDVAVVEDAAFLAELKLST